MVKCSGEHLNRVFGALSDPTRRAMLERLAHGNCCVGELAKPLTISGPAVTKHLRVLECAGLIARTKTGRLRLCRLQPEPLNDAAAWIERHRIFWDTQLDALARHFEEAAQKKPQQRADGREKGSAS